MAGLTRRQFLALGGAAATAAVFDPERLLWVPGARTFFLPSTEIVQAASMADALSKGFVAEFPDGARMEIMIGRGGDGMTLDDRLGREREAVRRMGGRIVANRQWKAHEVSRADD